MTLKKISIITPSFNQGEFIEQTIDSVLSQNYPNLEYIIIDGGSTDNSVEIIKKYEKHLKYWVSEPDKGQSHAINKGLKYVTGDIINWLNSDDYYEPDTFSIVNEGFNNNINVLCGKSRIFGNNNNKISKGTFVDFNNLSKTIGQALFDQPATFIKTNIFRLLLPINENLRYLMDRELWIKYLFLFGVDKIKKSDSVFVNFRMHNTSKTVSEGTLFNIERDSIYYSLASIINNNTICNIIENNCKINKNYHFPLKKFEPILIDKVLSYYILLLVEEFYYLGYTKKVKSILKHTVFNYIDEKTILKKLKIKNKIKSIVPLLWKLK